MGPLAAAGTGLLRPDRRFVEALIASGGGDLKKCFQCATCSVACGLSTGPTAFPRKEMHWAQWGLREPLFADPDVWLCHQCNDCSTRCPRGARPGDVLAAVRRQAVEHYAVPGFLARWVNRPGTLALSLLVPAALLILAIQVRDPLGELLGMEAHAAGEGFSFAAFFPHWLLVGFFSFFAALSTLAAAAGVVRFWRAMEAGRAAAGGGAPVLGIGASLLRVLGTVFRHERFAQCEARSSRRTTHLLVFYGFLALFGTTVWAVIDLYLIPLMGGEAGYPYGLLHPVKFLANAGAVLVVAGAARGILDRLRKDGRTEGSTGFDLNFLWLILAVGVTGIVLEVLRFSAGAAPGDGFRHAAHDLYLLHLVLVFGLLVFLPYSKFAHVIYRTVAMVHAERTGRSTGACGAGAEAATAVPGTDSEVKDPQGKGDAHEPLGQSAR